MTNQEEFILQEETALSMLIIEDNEDMLFFISDHFSSLYKIETAVDGREGWEKVLSLMPDIIISDIMMSVMIGVELCSTIKNDVRTSHIPVILLTAKDSDEAKIEGYQKGADAYVSKPFNIELLEVRVKSLVQNRIRLQERFKSNFLQPSPTAIATPDEEFIEQVIQYVEDNIMEPVLNVENLSRQVNMSRITLYRKMKAITGLTAVEFIRNVRLKKAAQLLSRKNHNVNEVCYMVCFSDIDYFRKCFKAMFGSLPKGYTDSKR